MRLSTRFLMACAAIGVLLLPANFVAAAIASAVPLAYAAMLGVWLIGPVAATGVARGIAPARRPVTAPPAA
ncbi:hypothetical protein [Actinoplanes aureus]|uniref:Uncharacterized protein n=1 Tax=Actinoplanes aureus TaxID=2792083 RepID=A0A931FXG5_9ACTN|nr:hypothetical protein [Actinoplanes aureus]MBG0560836.1 hypothetical protein [Actinoplanes aureus]